MTWIPQFCSLDTHRSAKLVVPSLIDRSLPQDSDTLRFVQQCLGGMGFSISARRAVDRKWWVFYKSHGSCLGVADSHNKYCGYWKHLALWHTLIITYTGYWSYIPLQWLTLVLGGIAIRKCLKRCSWRDRANAQMKEPHKEDFLMPCYTWLMHTYCMILYMYLFSLYIFNSKIYVCVWYFYIYIH